jgi:hypothetical protein
MKRFHYTLIELMAAMSIFIVMMGLLFNIFVSASTIVVSQSTKVSILSDASVFFTYISKDLSNISLSAIPHFLDKNNTQSDPESSTPSFKTTSDQLKVETSGSTTTLIAFRSDIEAYDTAAIPSTPYVAYFFDESKGEIYRSMAADEASYGSAETEAIILDGVEKFEIKVWDDRPGGVALTASTFATKPACITINLTLRTPNPNASAETIKQSLRTITKTIYIDR